MTQTSAAFRLQSPKRQAMESNDTFPCGGCGEIVTYTQHHTLEDCRKFQRSDLRAMVARLKDAARLEATFDDDGQATRLAKDIMALIAVVDEAVAVREALGAENKRLRMLLEDVRGNAEAWYGSNQSCIFCNAQLHEVAQDPEPHEPDCVMNRILAGIAQNPFDVRFVCEACHHRFVNRAALAAKEVTGE